MTDYKAQVRALVQGQFSGSEAMRSVIVDMVRDGIPEAKAEGLIMAILSDVFECDDWLSYLTDYRELRLKAGEGSSTVTPDDDPIFDVAGLERYMKRGRNWIYKNSHKLPHIQTGKRGKLLFRRSDIDKYLKSQSTPGLRG